MFATANLINIKLYLFNPPPPPIPRLHPYPTNMFHEFVKCISYFICPTNTVVSDILDIYTYVHTFGQNFMEGKCLTSAVLNLDLQSSNHVYRFLLFSTYFFCSIEAYRFYSYKILISYQKMHFYTINDA